MVVAVAVERAFQEFMIQLIQTFYILIIKPAAQEV
tara:strand:+ start:353 stop:457 length:105 start_codon:yes stop_codon:yes gene_type:complete